MGLFVNETRKEKIMQQSNGNKAQVLLAYANKNAYYKGEECGMKFCCLNLNESSKEDFITQYANGVVQGMRCKYKHPYIVAIEIDGKGNEKFLGGLEA